MSHQVSISVTRLWILGTIGSAAFLFMGLPGIGLAEVVSIVVVFLITEGFHVWIVAFKKSFESFLLCFFIPFYATYFVFKNSEELFDNSLLTKIWAVFAMMGSLAEIAQVFIIFIR